MTMRLKRRNFLASAVVGFTTTAFTAVFVRANGRLPKEHFIEIRKFKYAPDEIKVRVGDTITWLNFDIAPHTATARDKSWDTRVIKKGRAKSLFVTNDMATGYYCRFHPNMKANLSIATD